MRAAAIRFGGLMVLLTACGGSQPKVAAPIDPNAKVTSTPVIEPLAKTPVQTGPSETDSPIPITPNDPTWGSRNALVTIVQFSDFQCPFCARVEPTLTTLREEYGPEKLRIVWKNAPLPFHDKAKPAAEAAMGVFELGGNDAFWKFHDAAFANQSKLGPDAFDEWANLAGVSSTRIDDGIEHHTWLDKVEEDNKLSGEVGVHGTPGFLINGVLVSGAQPLDKFKRVIDEQMTIASELIEKGAPRDRVYVVASTFNHKNAPKPDDDEGRPRADTKTVYKVPVGSSPTRGSASAPVTIVEFSDFQCPYCNRVEPTIKQVLSTYGDQVRFVWKNEPLPFHNRAEPAAELALEARAEKGNTGFWDAHDALFASQPKLDESDLAAIGAKLGLNAAKVNDAIANHRHKRTIDADADLADDVQASGTPHFFINGRRLVGAQPFDKFKSIIDEEIVHAADVVKSGTPKSGVYEAIIKNGVGAPPLDKKSVSVPSNAPARGNLAAKVTIQEFSDFQCPFCKRAEDTVNEIMKNDGSRVKFVWRNLPLPMHPDAPLAAEAAMEAFAQKGNAGFWKMHDMIYAGQSTHDGLKRAALDGYAVKVGLDMAKFAAALDGETHKAAIAADEKAAHDVDIQGTPAFLINGYYISGAQPYAKLHKVIERALLEANGGKP